MTVKMEALSSYLADLEKRIDPPEEDRLTGEWLDFADLRCDAPYFAPVRKKAPSSLEWPDIRINDCFDDIDRMIYQQLKGCSDTLAEGSGELLAVRPNYGTGIIPSMFGAEVFFLPREADTLPGTRPLPNGKKDIEKLLAAGKVDFSVGLAGKAFAFAERWLELTAAYPRIARYIHVYNPDLQGPLPLAEMLWGSDMYLDIYDDEETVCAALDFFADAIIRFLKEYHALCPPFDESHSIEWGLLHRGGVMIRNDAAMNISGDMYGEFVLPRDQRIIGAYGGGVHFCGRGDHYIEHVSAIRGLSTFNMSQPECNDMETIYQNTIDKDIVIIGLPSGEVNRALSTGRALRGRVHCGASLAAWLERDKR